MLNFKVGYDNSEIDKIIAYDPGGTTGFARIYIDRARERVVIEEIGEFQTWDKFEEHLSNVDDNTLVVYEDFALISLRVNLIPVEVIGVLRYLCCAKFFVRHYAQMPRERIASEKWYPELDKFTSHYGSAVRHGIAFVVGKLIKSRWKLEYDLSKLFPKR